MAFESGLKINELYDLTPRQFNNCVGGYTNRQTELTKTTWEQTRQLMFAILSPNFKNRNTKVTDIMVFPWDLKTNEIDIQTEIDTVENENKKFWKEMDQKKKTKQIFKV